MRQLFIFLLFLLYTQLNAQERKTFKVQVGEKVSNTLLANNALYQYPQFVDGIVNFKGGRTGAGQMNYNRLMGEIQFIDEKGDTVSLSDEKEIETVQMGNDTFFFQQGYLQLIENFSVKIAKKTVLELSNKQRVGGFGESNPFATTYTGMWTRNGMKELTANEVMTFAEKTTYFIGDRFGNFKPLNKKSLSAFFSKKEKAIDAYLQANPVNFAQQEDVQRLTSFLKTL